MCAPHSPRAASLAWQDGCQQIQWEARAALVLAPPDPQLLNDLLAAETSAGMSIVATNGVQVEAIKLMQAQVPVLALPESGTLILLGIGLAGLASLLRRKNRSP